MTNRVSLQDRLFSFTNRFRPLLIQLFLKITKHLEKLTFSGDRVSGWIVPTSGLVVGKDCPSSASSMRMSGRGGQTVPVPLAAIDLPLAVAAVVAWEAFFFRGAIFDVGEAF